jgi:hypothetical protein
MQLCLVQYADLISERLFFVVRIIFAESVSFANQNDILTDRQWRYLTFTVSNIVQITETAF